MKKVVIFCLCLCLCFLSPLSFCAFADPVGRRFQTVDLTTVSPDSVSLQYRFDSSFDWSNANSVSGYPQFQTLSSSTFGYNYFPSDNQGNRYAMQSRFQYNNGAYKDFRYIVDYSLPRYDYPFDSGFSSIYLVLSFRLYRTRSAPVDNGSIFLLQLTDDSGASGSGVGYIVDQQSSEIEQYVYDTRFLIRFDSTVSNLSSVDRHLTLISELSFDFELPIDGYDYSRIFIFSNVLPFVVTSDYDSADAFASATYDVLNNNITPTLDNISQVVQSQAATASRALQLQEEQGIQASVAASAGMSQSAAHHSDSMAAISSLPEAQADAQIAAAASAAQASAAAEVSRDQATADSISNSIPDIAHYVNAPLQQFVNAFDDTGRTVLMEFPALEVPDFAHSGSTVTLTSSSIVDLSSWISWVESSQFGLYLISAARALITTGLLVYIVKVFISLVNYIISKGDLDDHIEDQIRAAEEFEETMSHLDYYKYDKRY